MTGGERQCPDDLVTRARRHELSDLERRALDAHLETCGPCRAASAMATLFDAIPESQPGDDQLVARVTAKATRARRRAGGHGLRAAAIVALTVLTSGAAVGAWLAHRATEAPTTSPPPPEAHASRGAARSPSLSKLATAPASPADDETPSPGAERPKPAVDTERKRQPVARGDATAPNLNPATVSAEPTPGALFARANAVRRAGEVREAIALYQTLRQRFPASEEARLAAISQGDLLLGAGEPARAIEAYAAYLRAAPHGSLTEEALFGRARGLGLLGRDREEREAWEDLARRFPSSAYHPAAERRLRELAP